LKIQIVAAFLTGSPDQNTIVFFLPTFLLRILYFFLSKNVKTFPLRAKNSFSLKNMVFKSQEY
jgi:hypothetical protein